VSWKIPISVLVVIHTPALEVLMLQRATRLDFWQSVTGSIDRPDEPLEDAAQREVSEETGIEAQRENLLRWNVVNTFRIWEQWRHRFPPGTTHNTEHVFSLQVPGRVPVRLRPKEHVAFVWLPWQAAADKCASWSNREAIAMLPQRMRARPA
jgi:dATP pyrophosphohydrolase